MKNQTAQFALLCIASQIYIESKVNVVTTIHDVYTGLCSLLLCTKVYNPKTRDLQQCNELSNRVFIATIQFCKTTDNACCNSAPN